MARKYFEIDSEKEWNEFKGALISQFGTITNGMRHIIKNHTKKEDDNPSGINSSL